MNRLENQVDIDSFRGEGRLHKLSKKHDWLKYIGQFEEIKHVGFNRKPKVVKRRYYELTDLDAFFAEYPAMKNILATGALLEKYYKGTLRVMEFRTPSNLIVNFQ